MKEHELQRALQFDKSRGWMEDRAWELGRFLGLSEQDTITLYRDIHETRTLKAPPFTGDTHEAVVASLNDPIRVKAHLTRQMLHYTRYKRASRLTRAFLEQIEPERRADFSVLDYGCGVADYGLAFALHGFRVEISDVAGSKLDFARERFKQRGFDVGVRPVDASCAVPSFDGLDAVVTAELLEHVVDPLDVLQRIHRETLPGAYLWFSDFPMREKTVGGEHLESAAARRLACVEFIGEAFEEVENGFVKFLYRKRM